MSSLGLAKLGSGREASISSGNHWSSSQSSTYYWVTLASHCYPTAWIPLPLDGGYKNNPDPPKRLQTELYLIKLQQLFWQYFNSKFQVNMCDLNAKKVNSYSGDDFPRWKPAQYFDNYWQQDQEGIQKLLNGDK